MDVLTSPPTKQMLIQNYDEVEFEESKRTVNGRSFLAMKAVIRNCESRVREWLAFHRLMGVERFFIALHDCEDRTEEAILTLPFAEDIILHHIRKGTPRPQLGAYQRLIQYYGETTQWLLCVDDDEFMVPTEKETIPDILKRYSAYGALALCWKWFGSSNHVTRPTGLVMESYIRRAEDNWVFHRGIKSIFRPRFFKQVRSPHIFECAIPTVTEHYHVVYPNFHWQCCHRPSWDVMACHHYKVRSMEDWVSRVKRGDCTIINPTPVDVHRFRYEDRNDVKDTNILRWADQVKNIIQ